MEGRAMRIGVLGTGTIASAVVHGIAGDGHDITISRRSEGRSSALAAAYETVTVAENQEVLDRSDVVFLGLMAETAWQILGALSFRPGQRVISFMAGASLGEVAEMVRLYDRYGGGFIARQYPQPWDIELPEEKNVVIYEAFMANGCAL